MKKNERRSLLYVGGAVWIALGCAALAPLASCSSTDCAEATGGATCEPTGGTGGIGGAGGTTNTGGSAGTGGTAGSGGSAGDPGSDGGGAVCGGIASLRCSEPDTTFCDYEDKSVCGMGDITGVCTPRPDNCTKDCPGVCGCNGMFYCNACEAQRAGTDALPTGTGSCSDAGTHR